MLSETRPLTRILSWLHLSDIHFLPKTSWKSVPARALLLEMLRRMRDERPDRTPDLIFCTGDVAFGEATRAPMVQQYAQAREFFDQLLGLYGLPKDRLGGFKTEVQHPGYWTAVGG